MSFFNLFACHKYLEATSSEILLRLAKCDHNNINEAQKIKEDFSSFSKILKGHASWEETFVFIHLGKEKRQEEIKCHRKIDEVIKAIGILLEEMNQTPENFYKIYLEYRKFHSDLLSHLHEEEIEIFPIIFRKLGLDGLRRIDFEIYKSMSSNDMIEMCKSLLPPCTFLEKKAILEDLFLANKDSLISAMHELNKYFSEYQWDQIKALLR